MGPARPPPAPILRMAVLRRLLRRMELISIDLQKTIFRALNGRVLVTHLPNPLVYVRRVLWNLGIFRDALFKRRSKFGQKTMGPPRDNPIAANL